MSAVVSSIVVFATLAFGAVYPWAYLPAFAAAASIGLAGLVRARGLPDETRHIFLALSVVALAIGVQLVPLPRHLLALLSPKSVEILSRYSLTFAAEGANHPISINPSATAISLVGLAALGLYLAGLPALLSRTDLRSLPRNLICFAIPLALFGIYTRQHNNGLVYGFWHTQERDYSNGFGPFINRNHFAGWMLMVTSLAIGMLCGRIESAVDRVPPGWRNRLVWLSTSSASRTVLAAMAVVVMAVSLVWTVSRSGIIGFVGALLCFVWLLARRRRVSGLTRLGVACLLGTVLVVSVSWRGIDDLRRWFADTTDVESRLAAWQDGWRVVRDFPLTGTGINTYRDGMLFYQKHMLNLRMSHAHNDYLEWLAEGGLLIAVPGMIALAVLTAAIVKNLNAARDNAYGYWIRAGAAVGLIAIGIQEAVEFSLHIPANSLLFATLAAVALSPISHPSGTPPLERR